MIATKRSADAYLFDIIFSIKHDNTPSLIFILSAYDSLSVYDNLESCDGHWINVVPIRI